MRHKILAMLLAGSLTSSITHAQFPDIPPGHYAENAVDRLTDLGVISGFPDGFFRGQKNVNRYELSLILTRMWDTWSTAQLSDLFSQISSLQIALEQLRQQHSQTQQELDAVVELQERLELTEDAITQLDARTEDADEVRSVLTTMQRNIANLRQNITSEASATPDLTPHLESLQRQLNDVRNTLNDRIDKTTARLDEHEHVLEALITRNDSWNATLTLGGGIDGETGDYLLGLDFESIWGHGYAQLSTLGPEVKAEGHITSAITALGRYHSTEFGTQGAFGVRFSFPSQLSVSVLGAHDGELVAGAMLEHDGNAEGAALPGVTVRIGALTNVAGERAIGTNLLLQGVAGITFGGDAFSVTPSAFYRRQAGADEVQTFGGELRLGGASETFTVSGAARYGIASDATQSVGAPEGDITLELASGAFASVSLTGGLPPLSEPVSFADASPLAAEQLILGAKVGITIPLDDLLQ